MTVLQLTDPSVTFLLKENQNLEVLDISCCPLLTGATIRNAVQVCMYTVVRK